LFAVVMLTNVAAQSQQDELFVTSMQLLENASDKAALKQAYTMAQQAIKAGNPDGYASLAIYQSIRGKNKKALSTLEKGFLLGSEYCSSILTNYYTSSNQMDKLYALYKKKGGPASKRVMAHMILQGYVGEQSASDLQSALALLHESVDEGDVISLLILSRIYQSAEYGVQNELLALGFLNRYLNAGGENALYYLGNIYADENLTIYNIDEAMEYYGKAAETGDADALSQMASYYLRGWEGASADTAKAVALFHEAADKGSADAAMVYATLLFSGNGVTIDSTLAYQYLYQAAQGGNGTACGSMGKMLFEGTDGFEKDVDSAYFYFSLGSQVDDPYCDYMMGKRYSESEPRAALGYFQSSMEHGNIDAAYYYAQLLLSGFEGDKEMVEEGFRIIKHLAEEYRYPDAFMEMAVCYASGLAVEQSYAKTYSYSDTADNLGSLQGTFNLGICYLYGYGCAADTVAYLRCMQKAADKGHSGAIASLGGYYEERKDYETAVRWFQKGADMENVVCMIHLAHCYQDGNGVILNSGKALELLRQAGELGSGEALYYVAGFYLNGEGVEQNIITAVEWLEKSAAEMYPLAYYMLGEIYSIGVTDDKGNKIEADKKDAIAYYSIAADYGYEPAVTALEKLTKKKKK